MPLPAAINDRAMCRLRALTLVLFGVLFAFYIWDTLHWPMIWDTPIMHYVRFLMSRGLRPYSQITDMNLPGCYLTEAWGMAIFGWSDLSWRIYEFFQLAVLALAGMLLGGRRNWFAGIFAAVFFIAMHMSEGPRIATERDELMAILLVAASALTMLALRTNAGRQATLRVACMFGTGLAAALATSLKPAALLMDAGLLTLFVFYERRRNQTFAREVRAMLAGNAIIAAFVLEFLARNHAFAPLWFMITMIVPNYTKLVQPGTAYMLRHLFPAAIFPIIIVGTAALVVHRKRSELSTDNPAQAVLLLGIAVGAISYFMQGKGLTYHRYMVILFVLLWVGYQVSEAMHRERTASRVTGVIGMALLFVVAVPYYLRLALQSPRDAYSLSPLAFTLQADLTHLGGDQLQRQVLCLDVIDGCFDALYRLRLEQNTGATGDLLLFTTQHDPAVDYYRNWVLERDRAHPANVVVLTNEWYQNDQVASFDKLHAWPQYEQHLTRDYVPVITRQFGPVAASPAYKIYLRKGSAVLEGEQANPLQ